MIPSAQQQAIFDFVQKGTGHALVVARAGTGKTTTIVQALEYIPPSAQVLCCAFNTRIRDVLLERAPKHVRVRTLHQLGRDTLSAFQKFRGWKHDEADKKGRNMVLAALQDTVYQRTYMKRLADAKQLADEKQFDDAKRTKRAAEVEWRSLVDAVLEGSRLAKATLVQSRPDLIALLDEYDLRVPGSTDTNELAQLVAATVRNALGAWPETDFDDEVWVPAVSGLALSKFDFVFVDEAQDLTLAQLRLAQGAARQGDGRIIMVGDPAQAIYRWRGADKDPFARFAVELNAITLPLTISYRCPKKVVARVQSHVKDFEAHPDAPEGIVERLSVERFLQQVRPNDFILSRINAPLAAMGLELSCRGYPTRVVGAHDIGKMLADFVKSSNKTAIPELLEWLEKYRERETNRITRKDGRTPLTKEDAADGMARPKLSRSAQNALDYIEDKIDTVLSFTEEDPETKRPRNVDEVVTGIERFFTEHHKAGAIVLSTVHRLKGDEANRVYVLIDTFFLSRGDAEEEANIHYVACTRAKAELYLVDGPYYKKKPKKPA